MELKFETVENMVGFVTSRTNLSANKYMLRDRTAREYLNKEEGQKWEED